MGHLVLEDVFPFFGRPDAHRAKGKKLCYILLPRSLQKWTGRPMYARYRVGMVKSELVVRGGAPNKYITNRGL